MNEENTVIEKVSDGFLCPDEGCGKVCNTEQGVKVHHAHIHNESLSLITRECEICGKEVERQESNMGKNSFCSDECFGEWKSEDMKGENHPNWTGATEMLDVECSECGKDIQKMRHLVENRKNNFCSEKCSNKWKSRNRSGSKSPLWKGGKPTLVCEYCGGNYKTQRSIEELSRFCSNQCMTSWQSENWLGEDHPSWNGGPKNKYYGREWITIREKCFDEKGEYCSKCGIDRTTYNEMHDRDLDIHHIKPVKEFESVMEASYMDNLMVLCRNCHLSMDVR